MTWINRQRARLQEREADYRAIRGGNVPDGMPQAHIDHKMEFALPATLAALAMIERGVYGICIDCEEEIPQARLESVPSASRCVSCQHDLEQNQ